MFRLLREIVWLMLIGVFPAGIQAGPLDEETIWIMTPEGFFGHSLTMQQEWVA